MEICAKEGTNRDILTVNEYQITLFWNEEDDVYIAEVPELPGCMAHAKTQPEAPASVNDAIVFWMDTARECGRAIPEPKGRKPIYA